MNVIDVGKLEKKIEMVFEVEEIEDFREVEDFIKVIEEEEV